MGTFACRKARRKTKNKTESSIVRKLRNMLVHAGISNCLLVVHLQRLHDEYIPVGLSARVVLT
jgi:hypothetical protein